MGTALKDQLNAADPNTLPDILRKLAFGDVVRSFSASLRKKVPANDANQPQLSTLLSLPLPNDAKAHTISRAYARAATTGTGELAVVAYGVTPTSGQIAVAPNGDLVTLASDAITLLDVAYKPEIGDIVELTLPCTASILTIPAPIVSQGVIMLLAANATVGSVTGPKIVLVPSASASATLQARLDLAKATVKFNVGTDVVTQATVRLLVCSAKDVDTLIQAPAFQ